MRIGVIGLGQMGGRTAAALVDAGHEVVAFDVAAAAVERAREAGVSIVDGPDEAARERDVVLISLPAPQHVREAVAGQRGVLSSLAPGAVIVDLSTVDPATSRDGAAQARELGAEYVDAPVLGRPSACGHWTLPVGGTAAAVEVVTPVLEVVARRVVHVGDVGAGNLLKLMNNLMYGAINAVTAEVFAACERGGLAPEVFFDTVRDSGAATVSNLLLEIGPKIVDDDYEPVFSLDLLVKDTRLGIDAIEAAGSPSVITRTVAMLNQMGQLSGYGPEDTSGLVRVYRDLVDDEGPHG